MTYYMTSDYKRELKLILALDSEPTSEKNKNNIEHQHRIRITIELSDTRARWWSMHTDINPLLCIPYKLVAVIDLGVGLQLETMLSEY